MIIENGGDFMMSFHKTASEMCICFENINSVNK